MTKEWQRHTQGQQPNSKDPRKDRKVTSQVGKEGIPAERGVFPGFGRMKTCSPGMLLLLCVGGWVGVRVCAKALRFKMAAVSRGSTLNFWS